MKVVYIDGYGRVHTEEIMDKHLILNELHDKEVIFSYNNPVEEGTENVQSLLDYRCNICFLPIEEVFVYVMSILEELGFLVRTVCVPRGYEQYLIPNGRYDIEPRIDLVVLSIRSNKKRSFYKEKTWKEEVN